MKSDPSDYTTTTYDVVIMGGGPAGATLGALLAKQGLSVAIFEKDFFPREHIGESFSHRVISVLEESGALAKVLASDIWVKKFGGYYAWDPASPATTFFDPESSKKDGVLRWAIHCNRAEFDDILLKHAAEVGAHVFEGVSVLEVKREGDVHRIKLSEGETHARFFVEASGRQTSLVETSTRTFLSKYKNIAIWNHVVGGKLAQTTPGDWNIFRKDNLSPIGNFAFEDGWFWYIPVPKMIQGKRTLTHSLGMVTDPKVLKDPAKRYTDPNLLMAKAKQVPLLRDLLVDAQPVSDKVLTATNYSMISGRFCNYDERWMLIGDAAYFVDPLFSSGVAFAHIHAAAAAALIKCTFDSSVPDHLKRECWTDYEEGWQGIARSFALAIDQWYHAISANNPNSVYWDLRAEAPMFNVREITFRALVDTGVTPDLLRVITNGGSTTDALGTEGPLAEAIKANKDEEPVATSTLTLAAGVALKESLTLEVGRPKATQLPGDGPVDEAAGRYWLDPVGNAAEVAPHHGKPRACHRFYFESDHKAPQIRFEDATHGGIALFERLRKGPSRFDELSSGLSVVQRTLLSKMCRAGMVHVAN